LIALSGFYNVSLMTFSISENKNIKQIIIYNRTDCCANRLSNYQVSISNKADFSTHIYQQDFHVAPIEWYRYVLDCVAGFPKARLTISTAITTVAVSLLKGPVAVTT
jgi:hypothetical protein